MSKDNAIQYIELPATPTGETPHDPVLPSACKTGGCGGGSGAAHAPTPMPAFAPVRVNGVEIAAEEIAREMQHHPAADGETAWHRAARALAIRELLLQVTSTCPLDEQQQTIATDHIETEEDVEVSALLDRELPPPCVTEEECRRYYAGHTHRFLTPDLFEAAHILIEPIEDTDSGWLKAKQQAHELAGELGDDARHFAEAARELSGCPTGRQDGSLGQVRRGELDQAVQLALEALPEGCTAREPVRSRFGWHLVRLHRRINGQTLPFELAREKILDMLEARAWVTSASKYIGELASVAHIEGVQLDLTASIDESPAL
ncbi:peptidylprolyl isomerase [Microbulbifer sp. OS29]|uniref:peptidylprolyl isomerase n=1 Tax=Microbulbifer okhotskensis TaxID=2926617 RepID=A0A9X2EU17_9GAMM|nr:peptidylprolyl isomerase [Microbulbifer okhotskensis]MCO1335781.1 peptidylprolyl isomerase [Microbulbifer okhotskensis]